MSKKQVKIMAFLNQLDAYINNKISVRSGVTVWPSTLPSRVELEAALMELLDEQKPQ